MSDDAPDSRTLADVPQPGGFMAFHWCPFSDCFHSCSADGGKATMMVPPRAVVVGALREEGLQ